MVKSAVLAWGSLVWDPGGLQTAGKFAANGPLLPIEFCRVSDDGRLTLAIDESFGALCKTYSAPSALEDSRCGDGGSLPAREGWRTSRAVGFVEPASGRQSDCRDGKPSPGRRDDRRLGGVDSATTPRSGRRSPAISTTGARAASRSPSPRRCNISKRWKRTIPRNSRAALAYIRKAPPEVETPVRERSRQALA